MTQDPDLDFPVLVPYDPADPLDAPNNSTPTDPILRSVEYRRGSKKGVRRPSQSVPRPTLPETKTVVATEITEVDGEDYVKVKAIEVRFEQSTGRYPSDPYGLIYDDDEVLNGAEPSIIVSVDATIGVPSGDSTAKDIFSAIPDDDGGWAGVVTGGSTESAIYRFQVVSVSLIDGGPSYLINAVTGDTAFDALHQSKTLTYGTTISGRPTLEPTQFIDIELVLFLEVFSYNWQPTPYSTWVKITSGTGSDYVGELSKYPTGELVLAGVPIKTVGLSFGDLQVGKEFQADFGEDVYYIKPATTGG